MSELPPQSPTPEETWLAEIQPVFRRALDVSEDIADQNRRGEIAQAIDDPDFKALADAGLQEEQAASLTELWAITGSGHYEAVAQRQQAVETEITLSETALAEANAEAAAASKRYLEMAEMLIKIAPAKADQARQLAAEKTAASRPGGMADLESRLRQLRTEQLAITEVYNEAAEPWRVPHLVAPKTVAPVIKVPAASPSTEVLPPPLPEIVTPPPAAVTKKAEAKPAEAEKEIGLSSLAHAVMVYAQHNKIFSVNELRENIQTIKDMDAAEYTKFKASFRRMRDQIVRYLETQGLRATWIALGNTKGRKYRLVTVPIPPANKSATLPTPVPAPSTPTAPKQPDLKSELKTETAPEKVQALAETPLAKAVMAKVDELCTMNQVTSLKRNYLAGVLSTEWNVPKDSVSMLLKDLTVGGVLFDGKPIKGSATITLRPPVVAEVADAALDQKSSEKLDQAQVETDVYVAAAIFDSLKSLKHHTQGTAILPLWRDSPLAQTVEEYAYRQSLRRIQRAGFIIIQKANVMGSRNSTRREVAVVKFPSQVAKDAWKNSPEQVLRDVRAALSESKALADESDDTANGSE